MKSILLTSTALVAFAGAAAADGHAESGITFTGEATLGYNTNTDVNDAVPAAAGPDGIVGNDDDVTQASEGFFWDSSVDVTMTAALDNGLVATGTFGFNVADNSLGDAVSTGDFVLSLAGESASLQFGNTDPVAEDRFGNVDGNDVGFFDQDAHFADVDPADPETAGNADFEAILVGEATFGGFTGAVSFGVDSDGTTGEGIDDVDAFQLHIGGAVGGVDLELAYQDELGDNDAVFGVKAGVSVAGADITASYLDNDANSSTGVAISYPFGPVTASAYYTANDITEDNYGLDLDYAASGLSVNVSVDVDGDGAVAGDELTKYAVEGSYEVGNGLQVFAGFLGNDEEGSDETFYVAGEYDLGGGAEVLVSYADDGNEDAVGSDLGDPEYKEGLTVQVSFDF